MVKDAGLNERFIEACIVGNQKRASAALAAGAEITYRSQKTGVTGFQCAARGGHQALAKHLLTLGSEVDSRDRDGCTALFDLVSEDNDVATATFLLDQGADVDAANNDGWTPLMVACTWDERWNDVVAMLIKRGANVNHIARDDWTPLMLAFNTNARNGPHTVLLAAKGLDLELVTPQYGWTPLLNAAAGTNLEAVRMLLERGANVHARMKVAAGKPFVAKTSLRARNRAGAIKAKPEHDGFTPLHWAKLKNRRCQPLLIKAGADLNAKSGSGKTATDLRVPPPAPQRASLGGHEHALLAAIAAAPDQDAPR